MATIRIDIDPAIDGRVLTAVANYFDLPQGGDFNGPPPPKWGGLNKRDFVAKSLRDWMLKIAREQEVKDAVQVSSEQARAVAAAAAADLDIVVS